MTARQRSISVALQQRPLRQTPGGRGTPAAGGQEEWAARALARIKASAPGKALVVFQNRAALARTA